MTSNGKPTTTVLLVDDAPENLELLTEVLRHEHRIKVATSGPKALQIAESDDPPDLILLDMVMPGMDGLETCRQLKKSSRAASTPVIFVTGMTNVAQEAQGLELGAVDYITKPLSPATVRARVRTHLFLSRQSRVLEQQVRERTRELRETQLEIVRRLGRAVEFKDNETGMHVLRMSHYAHLLAKGAGMSPEDAELILNAAPMHDIGKIGVPDRVLLKPGKLDAEEWELMTRHAEIGAEILGHHSSPLLQKAREIALTHHERWDGTGYPNKLAGLDIPLSGRIAAVADVFDALTSKRPYKEPFPVEKAVAIIDESNGSHFDPQLVELFHQVLPEFLEVKARYAES